VADRGNDAVIIHELQIKGFGKWRDAGFRFAPGMNLFSAPNESGKTTLLQAMFAALYGMKRDYVRTARYLPEYDKYLPWHGGPFELIVHYELAGKTYRLHRRLEKEREQAKLYLHPDWTEVTELYQEDRRKERNFLELHLGLTRTLFIDLTWVKREPLAAAEYLLPSLSRADSSDPAANRILAELERDLAAIGKKERAEHTLLGKAASLAAQKKREWEAAQAQWYAAQQLSKQIADWEAEMEEREKAAAVLRLRLDDSSEREWQRKWQNSYRLQDHEDLDEWIRSAATEAERRLHEQTKRELAALDERLRQQQVESPQERLGRLERQGGRAGVTGKSAKRGKGIRIGLAASSMLLALAAAGVAFGYTAAGMAAGALAVAAIAVAWWLSSGEKRAGEQAIPESWTEQIRRREEEISLREERLQIVSRWGDEVRRFLEREKAVLEQKRLETTARLAKCEEEIQRLREQIARAMGEIGRHDAVSLAKAKSEYDDAAAAMQQWQTKREVLLLAKETLQAALAEWNRDISPSVNRLASEVMARITEGVYRDVRLDPSRDFSVRLLDPAHQLVVEHGQCSTGTQDQLYFAQRIALLRHVSEKREALPLFLDDHFVHYDDERLKRTLDYLLELSQCHQVFLFSCQRREQEYLQPFLLRSDRHKIHQL
jgi:recombinational DNA repair ATPase RecF